MRLRSCFVVLFALASCSNEAPKPDAAGAGSAATAEPAQPTAPPPPSVENQPAYVVSMASMKREPDEKKQKVKDEKGKDVSNWLATFDRGEQVTILEQQSNDQGDWMKVRSSDDKEGWVKATSLLIIADGVSQSTVLEETPTYKRPDMLSVIPDKTIPPGDILFVTKPKDDFAEVNYSGSQKVWVEKNALSTDPLELEVGRLWYMARRAAERKDDAKAKTFNKMLTDRRDKFGSSKLYQLYLAAAEAGGAAPEGAPAAPPSGD